MRSANLRSKIFFVIIVCSSSVAMDKDNSSEQTVSDNKKLRERVEEMVRLTLEAPVRAYMYRCPSDGFVQLLDRYIAVVADNYLQEKEQKKQRSLEITEQTLTFVICKENLLKIMEVDTFEVLKIRLGAMGVIYDAYQPCNTWKHVLTVIQEQIKERAADKINIFTWPIKSLEPAS